MKKSTLILSSILLASLAVAAPAQAQQPFFTPVAQVKLAGVEVTAPAYSMSSTFKNSSSGLKKFNGPKVPVIQPLNDDLCIGC